MFVGSFLPFLESVRASERQRINWSGGKSVSKHPEKKHLDKKETSLAVCNTGRRCNVKTLLISLYLVRRRRGVYVAYFASWSRLDATFLQLMAKKQICGLSAVQDAWWVQHWD